MKRRLLLFKNRVHVGLTGFTTTLVLLLATSVTFAQTENIFEIVEKSTSHNTLETAINATGLSAALSDSTANLTLFAPTDAAFEALPDGVLTTLLANPEGELKNILLHHVWGSTELKSSLRNETRTTLLNENVRVNVTVDQGIYIDQVQITVFDIMATNGVVHVVDAVILPPALTVVDIVNNSEDHETLEQAIAAAELTEVLSDSTKEFTLFAPTDEAFNALPDGMLAALLGDPTGELADVLLHHTLAGETLYDNFVNESKTSLLDEKFRVNVTVDLGTYINNAKIIVRDVFARNGVVHVVDAVILPPAPTVVDIVNNSEDHETLEQAIAAAELTEVLSDSTKEFTLFAPTDEAFDALPDGMLAALLGDPTGELADVLLHHTLAGETLYDNFVNESKTSLLDEKFRVNVTVDLGTYINNAKIIVRDVFARNGVVHVVDAVILPPAPTVVDIVNNSEDHETLEQAIAAAELTEVLSDSTKEFTLFAPTDEAFDALPDGMLAALLGDPTGELADVLLHHTLAGEISFDDFVNESRTSLLNENFRVNVTVDLGTYINNAKIIVRDVFARNGVVHIVDAVILPPAPTVVDVVNNSEDHETLEQAIVAAELTETLSDSTEEFTLFAPTDAAFNALPEGMLAALLSDPTGELADVLLHHALAGEISFDDFVNESRTSLLGENFRVNVTEDLGTYINQSKIIVRDVFARNGVVHVVDAVILPPPSTVFDVVMNSDEHETLEAAIRAAELMDDLSDPTGTFTLFAPTDEAFDALPEGMLETLLLTPEGDLATILMYHVLDTKVMSSSLVNGTTAMTLTTEDVTITLRNDSAFIDNAYIEIADIETRNGVVHVINAVLQPPSIVGTDNAIENTQFAIYPNPVVNEASLSLKDDALVGTTLRILTSNGVEVSSQTVTGQTTPIATSNLKKGTYFVEISNGSTRTAVKIVK